MQSNHASVADDQTWPGFSLCGIQDSVHTRVECFNRLTRPHHTTSPKRSSTIGATRARDASSHDQASPDGHLAAVDALGPQACAIAARQHSGTVFGASWVEGSTWAPSPWPGRFLPHGRYLPMHAQNTVTSGSFRCERLRSRVSRREEQLRCSVFHYKRIQLRRIKLLVPGERCLGSLLS